jgi:hypothetical protein
LIVGIFRCELWQDEFAEERWRNPRKRKAYKGREFMSSSDLESPSAPESPEAEPSGALSGANPQPPSEDNQPTRITELELPENDTGKSSQDLTEEIPIERGAIADFAQNPPNDPDPA